MKTRTTLILLAIVVGLGLWIKFFESKQPNTAAAQRQAGNVLNFDRDKLTGIVIQNGDDRVELRKEKGNWRLTAPVQDRADAAAVDNLISDLETWRKVAIIPATSSPAAKDNLAEYGLSQPKLRLKLSLSGETRAIRFGKDAVFEGEMYIRLGDSKEVLIAGQNVRADISKKPDDFRDRKMTDLTNAQVTRAVLKTSAGELELTKKGEHWQITKPLQARGDDGKINDLLAEITNARIQEFIGTDEGDLHKYGLSEPRGSITLYSPGGSEGETLQIGAAAKDNKLVYVRFLPRHGIYALPKKTEALLATKPNDLRDRHLVRIDRNNLDRIHIAAAGKPEVVLARKGDNWTIASSNNQPANSAEVTRLLNALDTEQVTRFVADTAADLSKYGLDHPQLQLTFSSFASENTAESPAGEQPFLTLSFGKVEGNEVFARVGEEPFVVAVNSKFLDDIWIDPLRWQELSVFHFKPDQIAHFSRVTDREEIFERTGPKSWKLSKGNGPVDVNDVQSLLNTLASLRAVRWVGAMTAGYGFEKPEVVITFGTAKDSQVVHKLTIGSRTQDGMWYAKVDERDGVFLVNNPDFTAFMLPLTKAPVTPQPAAEPAERSPVPLPAVGSPAPSSTVPSPVPSTL